MALGHPIGASGIPVGKGVPRGNSVPSWPEESKETGGFVAHDFRRKSSVLYLLSRLARERGGAV